MIKAQFCFVLVGALATIVAQPIIKLTIIHERPVSIMSINDFATLIQSPLFLLLTKVLKCSPFAHLQLFLLRHISALERDEFILSTVAMKEHWQRK